MLPDPLRYYYGRPSGTLSNNWLSLEYLLEAGPRIVRLHLAGSEENLFAETPDIYWDTPNGIYNTFGGHRLWHAPEARGRTSFPDNEGLVVETLPDGVRLIGNIEIPNGIRKVMEVRLCPDYPAATVTHLLYNEGQWPIELSPWAITQLPLGGIALLPQDSEAVDPDRLLPNRSLVLWPYTRWTDPRLLAEDDFVHVVAEALLQPFKVGCFTRQGWVGYQRNGLLFRKRFQPRPGCPHPDMGCNIEVFTDGRFLELETLAPLACLQPGERAEHTEVWEVTRLPIPPAKPSPAAPTGSAACAAP